jgi:hypothetical protein
MTKVIESRDLICRSFDPSEPLMHHGFPKMNSVSNHGIGHELLLFGELVQKRLLPLFRLLVSVFLIYFRPQTGHDSLDISSFEVIGIFPLNYLD